MRWRTLSLASPADSRCSKFAPTRPAWDSNRSNGAKLLDLKTLLHCRMGWLGVRDGVRNWLVTASEILAPQLVFQEPAGCLIQPGLLVRNSYTCFGQDSQDNQRHWLVSCTPLDDDLHRCGKIARTREARSPDERIERFKRAVADEWRAPAVTAAYHRWGVEETGSNLAT